MGDHTGFIILAIIAICTEAFLLLLSLFDPGLRYKISSPPSQALDSDDFLCFLEAVTDAKVHRKTKTELLTNGEVFYEAMLDAIRNAAKSINLEAYIFQRGRVAERFINALAERASAGVKVNVVLDALGSLTTINSYMKPLLDAGGKVAFYHPLRWNTWPRYNNRTHRELLVIDGKMGFIGGAGIADHWLYAKSGKKRWRDSVVRIEGDAAVSLQSTFVENWLEAQGEILAGEEYFPQYGFGDHSAALIVNSSPSAGGSTRARVLFQTLLASAQNTIRITTPYFLPDESLRRELVRAVKRGVRVSIITPGRKSDHALTRSSSRRLYGELLEAGAEIHEYQPAMIHAKILIVDSLWSVVGSTNFDNRSFGLNDEVNLVVSNRELARALEADFQSDLCESDPVTLKQWERRPIFERAQEMLGWILQRQQ